MSRFTIRAIHYRMNKRTKPMYRKFQLYIKKRMNYSCHISMAAISEIEFRMMTFPFKIPCSIPVKLSINLNRGSNCVRRGLKE